MARPKGKTERELIEAAQNLDEKEVLKRIESLKVQYTNVLKKKKDAKAKSVQITKNGVFEKYHIPEKLNENIFEQYQLVEQGHVIENYLHERMGYIYYMFDNKEDLDNAALNFNNWIKIDYLEG